MAIHKRSRLIIYPIPPPANQVNSTVPEDTVLADIDPEWLDNNDQGNFDTVDEEIHNTVD